MAIKEIDIIDEIDEHEEEVHEDFAFEGFPAESIDLVLERIKYPVIILAAVYFGWNILMYCPEGFLFILLFSLIGLTIYGLIE